jgi:hypothetical protein
VERPTWPFWAATCRPAVRTAAPHPSAAATCVRRSGGSPDRTGQWPVPPCDQRSVRAQATLFKCLMDRSACSMVPHSTDSTMTRGQSRLTISITLGQFPTPFPQARPTGLGTSVREITHRADGSRAWVGPRCVAADCGADAAARHRRKGGLQSAKSPTHHAVAAGAADRRAGHLAAFNRGVLHRDALGVEMANPLRSPRAITSTAGNYRSGGGKLPVPRAELHVVKGFCHPHAHEAAGASPTRVSPVEETMRRGASAGAARAVVVRRVGGINSPGT